MLKAYIDGSWNDELMVFGGVVAPRELWPSFENDWRSMLDRFGVRYRFHATEYWSRKGEFMRMKESDHAGLGQEIRRIFSVHRPHGFACVIDQEAYRQWRRKQSSHHPKDAAYYALDWCLTLLIQRINQSPADDGVQIICDEDKGRERIAHDMAEWKTEQLRDNAWRFPGYPDPNRGVDFRFGSSKEILQLQAADTVTHTCLRWSQEQIKTGTVVEVPFIAEMQSMLHFHPLYTLEDIELMHRIKLENEELHKENLGLRKH